MEVKLPTLGKVVDSEYERVVTGIFGSQVRQL